MDKWLDAFNQRIAVQRLREEARTSYSELHESFVNHHLFFDGNGRIALLVSNSPVLKSVYPPILVPLEMGKEYIDNLVQYKAEASILKSEKGGD